MQHSHTSNRNGSSKRGQGCGATGTLYIAGRDEKVVQLPWQTAWRLLEGRKVELVRHQHPPSERTAHPRQRKQGTDQVHNNAIHSCQKGEPTQCPPASER